MERQKNHNENYTKPYIIVANSTVLFLLAYVFIYSFPMMATEYVANKHGINIRFNNYAIEYLTPNDSPLWTKNNIISIFAIGPAITFFMSFLFWYISYELRSTKGLFKLFFTWAYILSFNLTFGGLIAGIATLDGLLFVFNWSGLSPGLALILGIISGFVLFFIGKASKVSFLRTAYNRDWILMPKAQIIFKLRVIYLPYFIGSLLLFATGFPSYSLFYVLQIATLIILFLPTMSYYSPDEIRLSKVKTKQFLAIGFIILLVIHFTILTLYVKL